MGHTDIIRILLEAGATETQRTGNTDDSDASTSAVYELPSESRVI